MACKTSYELHHHFPKLAEESGFAFNTHRPRNRIDWNKIKQIDVENLIRERRFVLIEQYLNDILNCVLESEFDVRILDEGVLKIFRLAQLAVEYQQFCRHYLDRSVYVLREELTALAQELDMTKKDLREREEEIRKMKRKSKHTYRNPPSYGNDNLANMILKTLTNKSDILTTTNGDTAQYNKCPYCDKVFLNQLYLKSHMSRRHSSNIIEVPQKDITEIIQNPNDKEYSNLNEEISVLKTKLKDMETFITQLQSQARSPNATAEVKHENVENIVTHITNTKDAEVSTNKDDYLLGKFEEWKKEEYERYNKEISLLRTQVIETINSFKDKEESAPRKPNLVEQLHVTIKQQGAEILALKQELDNSKLHSEDDESKRKVDAQMSFWAKRAETQSKQYEAVLQKLNEVAKEAHESRAIAEAERERAAQLQALLQQSVSNKPSENKDRSSNNIMAPELNSNSSVNLRGVNKRKRYQKTKSLSDRTTLETLHRKAQELLSIESTSSSDVSSASSILAEITKNEMTVRGPNSENFRISAKENKPQNRSTSTYKYAETSGNNLLPKQNVHIESSKSKQQNEKLKKAKSKSQSNLAEENNHTSLPGSPVKLVRAKLTEEINNRLVSAGVDPLKSRLSQNVFHRHRMQLQQQCESKSKKTPGYQEVRHRILAYLDSSTSDMKKQVTCVEEYTSPNKMSKAFSLTSVLSNVKSKALSLVKSNDGTFKANRNVLNAEVAKKVMSLLRTPPDSGPASPAGMQRISNEIKSKMTSKNKLSYNIENMPQDEDKQEKNVKQMIRITDTDSGDQSNDSEHKYYNPAIVKQLSTSVENLVKSPARRPASANATYTNPAVKNNKAKLVRTQSALDVCEFNTEGNNRSIINNLAIDNETCSDEEESLNIHQFNKSKSEENIYRHNNPKQTKGVLKNASSTSTLSKKKVLFDMEAIQMKSVSASPSQTNTDKSDASKSSIEKFELGLINLDGEEWDISSIENEPLKNDTRIQVNIRTSPNIAKLKQTIESQLARRNGTPSTALVGGVDVLAGPMGKTKAASIAGSNTSLGSSILDESEDIPVVNNKAFVKPKKITEKDDSELDLSEYGIDGLISKKNESF